MKRKAVVQGQASLAYLAILRACTKKKDLCRGTRTHHDILKRGLLEECSDALVMMYAKCGEVVKAQELFDRNSSKDVLTWTALMAGYTQNGQGQTALDYFEQMKFAGISPDAVTYSCLLKACGSIRAGDKGAKVHDEIAKSGLLINNVVLGSALVNMYAKCGELVKARQVLDELPIQDVISWNALIAGYVKHGEDKQALKSYERMKQKGLSPDAVTYACLLKACSSIGARNKGEKLSDEIIKQGLLGNDVVLGTAMVDMYATCGALTKAHHLFEGLPVRNVASWNALLAGYTKHGPVEEALSFYDRMQGEGLFPDAVTYSCILKACGSLKAAHKGENIHEEIAKRGLLQNNIMIGTSLVDMYAKCGMFSKAEQLLMELPSRDVVPWNALLAGYVEHGEGDQALSLFEQMKREALSPDALTYTSVLKACGSVGRADKGESIHYEIAKRGLLESNITLHIALVDMYLKSGTHAKAQEVLEDLVNQDSVSCSAVMFNSILKACACLGADHEGEKIHHEIAKQGLLENNVVLGNAVVNMYAKCGALTKARQVLKELPVWNAISWNTLIAGCMEHGEGENALGYFQEMQEEGVTPDALTYSCILKACGSLNAVEKGREIHYAIANQGLLADNLILGNALVGMYAACGSLSKARHVLEELPVRNAISWNGLIGGYAGHGEGEQALECFGWMQCEGLSPTATTFSSVLSACSRLGLLEDARTYFESMTSKYRVRPELEHYTCMVDVFGRAGHLDKAVGVIEQVVSLDMAVWLALLGVCQKWSEVEVGRWAFECALEGNKNDAAVYVLMAEIYAGAGMEKDARNIEAMRMENKAWKKTLPAGRY